MWTIKRQYLGVFAILLLALPAAGSVFAQPLLSDTKRDASKYPLVYTVQLAVYNRLQDASRFAEEHRQLPLYCRQKENGMAAVYYGVYQDAADAGIHQRDYLLFAELGAYVVKLTDVSLTPCKSMLARIKKDQTKPREPLNCIVGKDCPLSVTNQRYAPKLQMPKFE